MARAPLRPAAPCPTQRRAPRRPADGDGLRPDHGSEAQGRVSPAPLPPASAEAHGLSLLPDKPVLRGVDVTSGRAVVITKHSNTPLSSTAKSPTVLCKGTRLDRGAATGPSRWPLRGPALLPLLRPRERHQRQCALAWTQPGCSVLAGAGAVPPGHTAFLGLQGNILCFSSNHALPGGHRRTTLQLPLPPNRNTLVGLALALTCPVSSRPCSAAVSSGSHGANPPAAVSTLSAEQQLQPLGPTEQGVPGVPAPNPAGRAPHAPPSWATWATGTTARLQA